MVDPVRVAGSVLPVVRGWEATPSRGQRGPEPRGAVDLVGWLQPSESTVARDDDPGDNVLPQLRVADLAQHFDEDLYGAYVVPAPGQRADGLVPADLRQLPDASRFTAIRNLLYAIEWWFFGAFAALRLVALGPRHHGRAPPGVDRGAGAGRRAPADSVGSRTVSRLFWTYRVLALMVGVLLAFCALVALPAEVPRRRGQRPPAVR